MPIYEYNCVSCSSQFELLRAMSQVDESVMCQRCGGTASRMPSVFISLLTGSNNAAAPIANSGGGGCGGCGPGGCGCANRN